MGTRGLRVLTVVSVLGMALTACTSGSASDSTGADGRTVVDGNGVSVTVPRSPARVVALSEPTLDGALALGVDVVGTTSGRGQGSVPGYLSDQADGIPIVASVAGPNIEQILVLKPDLIVTDGTVAADESVLGKLAGIAPTVFVSKKAADWKGAFTSLAEVLGKSAEAEKVLAGYASRVDEIRGKLGDHADDTVSIVRWGTGQPSVILKELPPSKVVADVGLRRPAAQDKDGLGHSTPVSRENLDQLDADWMFFGTLGGATNPQGGNTGTAVGVEASAKMLQDDALVTPGFTQLTAYRNKHVIPVDGSAWASAGGPFAATVILDQLGTALLN
ncbi:iron complex transport system substrate-binding protein [Actinoplanes lutulentus]|uniref:Iron complex transport system substrate-binding protein n=1 Tax=Actinoplanes lutulentus TaxID=1287878 RepID=A0A327ZF83_9ACTN|nr:iron complex transport system substrate-binding protein [Actinoplanes lutulentus]